MKKQANKVIFLQSDMHFVKKFGIVESANMVIDYKSLNRLPFIYDIYQLSDFLKIRPNKLFYILRNIDQQYKKIIIKKRNGKDRILYSPSFNLSSCQRLIRRLILEKMPVSRYAKAYVKGTSLYDNALPHVNKKYILKLDITNFFGSIDLWQVYVSAFNTRYFPKQIGCILATLCCKNRTLPQGASSSPALSNIVMRNFDNNIGKWCERNDIVYTRYCDDMTFSSDKPLYSVYRKAKAMLNEMGFEINETKTHFVTNANRQSVTGLTVNEKVAVSSDYKRKLRQDIYYALKFGFSDSIMRSGKDKFITESGADAYGYYCHLVGRVKYVLQIEPQNKWFNNAFIKLRIAYVRGEVD